MRKRAKKLLALLTAVTITVTGVNVPAAQAAKVKVTASKTTLYYNGTSAEKKATVTVKNVKGKKVTYSISKAGKKIVKLGDVSGNKTKKFTVTAKKKGTAKVTVKVGGKKVKTVKFTVKKKTTKATPEPTVAPTVAPTQEPSQEPTVAPSDEPTVAPTDAPSDAPTATPSEEPVKDKSVVSEIKILNETALTNENGTQAYVYYDVLDQYGESMRESCTIEWTTNPSTYTVDKATGKITITKADGFAYGNDIVLVGVHAESGVSKQANVKVGLTQQVDTISFEGFVNSTDTTKKLDAIGADFANGTSEYYLLFKTYDQNGNVLDVTESEEYTGKNLTFVADNPLVLGVKSGNKTFTIDGKAYAACKVTPGLYAGKGGEVNITAISTKTGNKTTKNIVVGGQGVLQSLELQVPSKTICDGDSIELDYVAKDTAGNEVKNYETIVRSANKLSIDASAGTLNISENNDGTAKITWSDEYDATSGAANGLYSDAISYDGISRLVTLNTIVIGGATNYIQLSVSDARIPVAVSLPDFTVASRANKWMSGDKVYTFKDQYGATLKYDKAKAFLTYASANGFGKKGEKYKLFTKATDGNAYKWDNAEIGSYMIGVNGVTSVQNTSVYASIRKYTTEEFDPAKSEDAGKKSTFTVTAVPLTKMVGFEISGADSVLEIEQLDAVDEGNRNTNYEDASGNLVNKAGVNVTKYAPNSWTDNRKVEVAGLYKGAKLTIAGDDYSFDQNVFTLSKDGSTEYTPDKDWGALITSIKPGQILAKKAQDLKNGDFKEFALDLKVTVSTGKDAIEKDDKDVTDVVTKPITFSMADEVVTSVSFGINQSNPELTDINQLIKDVTVLDQYGYPMDLAENDVTIKASDVVEAVTEFTHADSSLVVLNNGIGLSDGKSTLALKGAELGDTLKVTATVKGTKVTSSTSVTIGADSYAHVSAGKEKCDHDSALCKKLGYSSSK